MIENVVVNSVEGDRFFKVFRGKLVVRGAEARFEGVVYQSVGGPNVHSSIDAEDVQKLVEKGLSVQEIEKIQLELQQKILNGEINLEHGQ